MTAKVSRPPLSSSEDLLAYSKEHLFYECQMLFWLLSLWRSRDPTAPPSLEGNARIEATAIHVRNLVEFLFEPRGRFKNAVRAVDFFPPDGWKPHESAGLERAREMANKQIAHLTTERFAGSAPEKQWDFVGLADLELLPVLRRFVDAAPRTTLSSNVVDLVREHTRHIRAGVS